MKKVVKVLLSTMTALCLCLSMAVSAFAQTELPYASGTDLYTYMNKCVYFMIQRNDEAVAENLAAIQALGDEDDYAIAKDIVDYCQDIDKATVQCVDTTDLTDLSDVEEGLPSEDHAFIVLGYNLIDNPDNYDAEQGNLDAFMEEELKGRCRVAYKASKAYPNSYILLTGGKTADKNNYPDITEADVMYYYLTEVLDMDSDRIIIEDGANNTVENGLNSMPKLIEKGVTSMSIITSDYHVKRGSCIFKAVAQLYHSKGNGLVASVGNMGWKSGQNVDTKESISARLGTMGMSGTLGLNPTNTLTGIKLSGRTTYNVGEDLDLKVAGVYSIEDPADNDLTEKCTFSDFDNTTVGAQEITATYTITNSRPRPGQAAETVYTDTITVTVRDQNVEVMTVNELIDAIPSDIDFTSNDDLATISTAKEAYEALDEEFQDQVNYKRVKKLTSAVKAVQAIEDVKTLIDAIPSEINLDDTAVVENIKNAKESFDALTEAQQGAFSSGKVKKLTKAYAQVEDRIAHTISKATVTTILTYTGKALTPKVTVKAGNTTLKENTDYTVSYKNNINVGTATVTVTAKGDYFGSAKATFAINPAKAAIKKVKAGKKQFKVTASKKAAAYGATRFRVAYKKGSGSWKYKTTTATSLTVKKLSKGKKYTVKICAQKKVNKKWVSGAWSATKTVKIK